MIIFAYYLIDTDWLLGEMYKVSPANPNFALSGFDNNLWQKINALIN